MIVEAFGSRQVDVVVEELDALTSTASVMAGDGRLVDGPQAPRTESPSRSPAIVVGAVRSGRGRASDPYRMCMRKELEA